MPDQPLSGGQLQRLGLARAVFGTPPIVVLDEPNSALDEAGEAALREAIRALKAAGSAVVLMTHRRAILDEMDKVLMLRQGAVVKYGARADVLAGLAPAATPTTAPATALPPAAVPEAISEAVSETVRIKLALAEPPVQAPPAAAEAPEEPAPARRSVSFLQAPADNSDTPPPPAVFFHRDSKARSLPQPLPDALAQRRSAGLARLAAATAAIAEARAKRESTTP
jgi:ABC-type glutathione transport system ATPase component